MEPVGCEYPKEFPLAELRRLIGYVRGSLPFDLKFAVHDAYHVLGFALNAIIGDAPSPVGIAKAADALQRAVDSHAVQGVDLKPVGFDWTALIPVILTPTYAPPMYAAPMGFAPSMGFGVRSCGPGGCGR